MNKYQAISILSVAARLGIVIKNNKAICFAHDEKTPSLSFNDRKGVYFCHGCGIKGNVFTLVSIILKLDSKATSQWFDMNYFYVEKKNSYSLIPTVDNSTIANKGGESDYRSDPEIYRWLIQQNILSMEAEDYLVTNRGFSKDLIHELKIRDILNPIEFFKKLENKWGRSRLVKCGLLSYNAKGLLKPIWWDHIITFPFEDLDGEIIYLQARRFNVNDKIKYVNLKGVKKEIFNLKCIAGMKPGEKLFICEGIPDTITMLEYGQKAIGILGANSFNPKDVITLLDYTIYVIPDSDPAGQGMAQLVIETFKKVGKPVKKVNLPNAIKDINELLTSNNRD